MLAESLEGQYLFEGEAFMQQAEGELLSEVVVVDYLCYRSGLSGGGLHCRVFVCHTRSRMEHDKRDEGTVDYLPVRPLISLRPDSREMVCTFSLPDKERFIVPI